MNMYIYIAIWSPPPRDSLGAHYYIPEDAINMVIITNLLARRPMETSLGDLTRPEYI